MNKQEKDFWKREIPLIIDAIKAHESWFKNKALPNLQEYVKDKRFPISERFEIWSKYCDKKDHPWIINKHNVPVIGKWVEDMEFYFCEDRYRKVTWDQFYDIVEDAFKYPDEDEYVCIHRDIKSLDDFKELLIETNFGSYYNDW